MPKPAQSAPTLFDTPDGWSTDPDKAGRDWIATSGAFRSLSTQKIYSSMWAKFAGWLAASTRVHPAQCQSRHIFAFLSTLDSARQPYRIRYVKLLERIYRHLMRDLALCSHNPATDALEEIVKSETAIAGTKYQPMRFLTRDEYLAIASYVRAVLDDAGKRGLEKEREAEKMQSRGWIVPEDSREWAEEWVAVRDAAITAMMLEGGLKVGEVVALAVNLTESADGRITVTNGSGRTKQTHDAKLLPLAAYALAVWRPWRRNLGRNFAGVKAPLFPAAIVRRTGPRTTPARRETPAMHTRTVYHLVHDILGRAGIAGDRKVFVEVLGGAEYRKRRPVGGVLVFLELLRCDHQMHLVVAESDLDGDATFFDQWK